MIGVTVAWRRGRLSNSNRHSLSTWEREWEIKPLPKVGIEWSTLLLFRLSLSHLSIGRLWLFTCMPHYSFISTGIQEKRLYLERLFSYLLASLTPATQYLLQKRRQKEEATSPLLLPDGDDGVTVWRRRKEGLCRRNRWCQYMRRKGWLYNMPSCLLPTYREKEIYSGNISLPVISHYHCLWKGRNASLLSSSLVSCQYLTRLPPCLLLSPLLPPLGRREKGGGEGGCEAYGRRHASPSQRGRKGGEREGRRNHGKEAACYVICTYVLSLMPVCQRELRREHRLLLPPGVAKPCLQAVMPAPVQWLENLCVRGSTQGERLSS